MNANKQSSQPSLLTPLSILIVIGFLLFMCEPFCAWVDQAIGPLMERSASIWLKTLSMLSAILAFGLIVDRKK